MNPVKSESVETFLRDEYEGLWRYAYRMTQNYADAEELVQEACLRFCHIGLGNITPDRWRALLYWNARNLAVDGLRRRKIRLITHPEVRRFLAQAAGGNLNPEQHTLMEEHKSLTNAVLESMPEVSRNCLVLRAEGLSYKEIAEALSMNPTSVGKTLARALQSFRSAYEEMVANFPKAASSRSR